MSRTILLFILKFVVLVLAQAVIFNNIVLFHVAVPFVFLYILVSMPITWSTNATLTIGFLTGLCLDVLSNSLGINTVACTLLAFIQKPVFHLYMQPDETLSGLKPSSRSMGSGEYAKYMSSLVLIYCTLVFLIDAFAVFNPLRLILQIVCSTAFTVVLIYALDSILTNQKHEKRL